MLAYLKNPPEPFEDVIRTHFKLKARSIRDQLDRWLQMDDRQSMQVDGAALGVGLLSKLSKVTASVGGSGSAFERDVNEMKEILTRLELEDDTTAVTNGSGSGSDN